jgi:hypothetical protein
MTGGEASRGIRMEYARSREPSVSQNDDIPTGGEYGTVFKIEP